MGLVLQEGERETAVSETLRVGDKASHLLAVFGICEATDVVKGPRSSQPNLGSHFGSGRDCNNARLCMGSNTACSSTATVCQLSLLGVQVGGERFEVPTNSARSKDRSLSS